MAKPKRILFVLAICAVFSIMTFREMPDGDPEMPSNNWRRELDNFEFEWPGLKPTGAAQSPLGLFEGLPSRRIVVTGGGGNIGKHLVRRLLASHTAVTVVDLIFNVEEHDYADPTLLTWITADIRNATALDHALTPDVIGVIHLAAVSRVLWCLANEPDCMDVNERGTGVVLAAIERKPESFRPWFILASSKEVYARKSNQTSPVGDMPLTVYGISKLKAEQVLQGHAHHVDTFSQRSFQAVVLRMSSVYGSLYDHKDRLVSTLVSRALAHQTLQIIGGEQEIDFLYIDDCVNAFILAATRLERKSRTFKDPQVTVEVFDVSGSGSIVLQHLVHKILILTQSKSPIQTFQRDKRFSAHYIRSPKKAALPGYSSKISLDSGLIRLVGFHLEQSASYLQQKMENECAQESQPHVIANQDLLKLDGCQANLLIDVHSEIWSLAFDRNPKHPESPDDMGPGTPEDWGPIWVISENIIPDIVKVAIESREDRFFVQIYADRTYAAHRLGVFAPSLPEFTKGFMFDHIEPDHVGDTAVVEWEMIVNQIEGSFKLVLPDSGYQVQPPTIYDGWFAWISADVEIYPFRLIPICCPAPPPWPFYEQDPIQHSIHLDRSSKLRPFNKTIPQTMCLRVASAITHVQQALAFLGEVRRNGIVGHPRQMGSAADFVDNGRIPCSNDCNHPTICIDTGDCACMASIFCPPLDRFPFSSSLHTTVITYPSPWTDTANASLLQIVERSSWLNVLRPEATRYLGAEPTWPSVHIAAVDATSESMRGPRLESVARLLDRDCFSADASMELALRDQGVAVDDAEIIFQPYYHARMWTGKGELAALLDQLAVNYPNQPAQVVLPLTYDWAACMFFTWTIWEVRQSFRIDPALRDVVVWSVMGDLNSPCYRPHQDVVIPPRSCRTRELRPAFSDPAQIRPAAERTTLVHFSGTTWGSGGSLRRRIVCKRPIPNEGLTIFEKSRAEMGFSDAPPLEARWQKPRSHADYVSILNNTIFCASPAGVAGWAPRIEDAIFSGCIPVLFDDSSHLPFWEMLDWSKFSVRVFTHEVQNLENVLMGYSLREIQLMQANLIHIRDILMYPLDDHHSEMNVLRSPLSFVLHQTRWRLSTKWPTYDDWR